MDLNDACRLLDVEQDADEKVIRRAYLRGVKRHKPDHDPDGFQRVREAYEVLQEHVRWAAFTTLPPESSDPSDSDDDAQWGSADAGCVPDADRSATTGAGDAETGADMSAPAEPTQADDVGDEEPSADDVAFHELLDEAHEQAAEEKYGEAVATTERAVALRPHFGFVYSLLAQRLDDAGRSGDALRVLLGAHAGGVEGMDNVLLEQSYGPPPYELLRRATRDDGALAMAALEGMVARDEGVAASELVIRQLDASHDTDSAPWGVTIVDLLLLLEGTDATGQADRVGVALKRWTLRAGGDHQLFAGRADLWMLVRQMAAARAVLTKHERRMFARALRENDLSLVRTEFAEASAVRANELLHALGEVAPGLLALIEDVLTKPTPRPKMSRFDKGMSGYMVGLALFLLWLLRNGC